MTAAPVSHDDVLRPRKGIYIAERGTHIPATYIPHAENVVVKKNGVPLLPQFRVRDVAPERRWAIAEDGEILAQHIFDSLWPNHIIENLRLAEEYLGNPHARIDIRPEQEPVPNVLKYVSVKVDPGDPSRLTLIHYDPHKKAKRGPSEFFSADGERVEDDRMAVLVRSYNDPKGRSAMRPGEIEEVENHLGISDVGGSEKIKAQIDMLMALKASGDITPEAFDRKLAALTGVEVAPAAPAVPATESGEPSASPGSEPGKLKRGQMRAQCGAVIASFQSKKHAASCETCQTIAREE